MDQQTQEEDQRSQTQTPDIEPDVPKNVKIARLYYFLYLLKRLIMIFIVVLLPNSLFEFKISILVALQTAYIVYSIFNRSFDQYKDHVVEIFNEFVLLILMILLNKYNSESDWTEMAESLYIGIILSQLWILLFVSLINGCVKLVKAVNQCINSNSEETQNRSRSIEASNFANISFSDNDQMSDNRLEVPRGSNIFNIKAKTYQDNIEDEKEIQESKNDLLYP